MLQESPICPRFFPPAEPCSDDHYMHIARTIAGMSEDCATGNYKVGCLVVDPQGQILAHGYRAPTGILLNGGMLHTHAEQMALATLDELAISAKGCTVYSTLEPCSDRPHGVTTCTERLIQHGVARVVFGHLDHNHTGPGIICEGADKLRAAGIKVDYLQAHSQSCDPVNLSETTMFSRLCGSPIGKYGEKTELFLAA